MSRPDAQPGEWIEVAGVDCVFVQLFDEKNPLGDGEIVCAPKKPANKNIRWNGGTWEFMPSDDSGGYADKYPRLRRFVVILSPP